MRKKYPNLIVVGVLCGAHGVHGRVRVKSFMTEPATLFDYAPFLDEEGRELLSAKTVTAVRDYFLVSPVHPRAKEEWDVLKGTKLYIERACLPDTDSEEYYIEDLTGLRVIDEQAASIGHIHAVFNHGAGDILEIEPHTGGKRVLVPFTREDVPGIDMNQGHVTVARFGLWRDDAASPDSSSPKRKPPVRK